MSNSLEGIPSTEVPLKEVEDSEATSEGNPFTGLEAEGTSADFLKSLSAEASKELAAQLEVAGADVNTLKYPEDFSDGGLKALLVEWVTEHEKEWTESGRDRQREIMEEVAAMLSQ